MNNLKFLFVILFMVSIGPFPAFAQKTASPDRPIFLTSEQNVVQTNAGKIRGYVHDQTHIFKGIPYGKADRFMAPQKPDSWDDIRNTLVYGAVCPTDETTSVNDKFEFAFQHNWGFQNEDCLNLNVWTPSIDDKKKRPVMVWFHGGGFTAGSSIELPSYDGENLSQKGDVVVVSVNHRLNVLGFLNLSGMGEKYKNSSNAGLMDLVLSLEWVKDNIENFGGDPENVTIFGQSGGGGKVTCMMNAPTAKGLFDKAIVQSGSYLSSFTEDSVSQLVGQAILADLELDSASVDSLSSINYDTLYAAGKRALKKVSDSLKASGKVPANFGLSWGPTHEQQFLPYQPDEEEALDLAKSIPLMLGSTKNEFMPFVPGTTHITMEEAKAFLQKTYGDKTDAYMKAVTEAYPETKSPSDYVSIDMSFRSGAVRQANHKAIPGAAPIYMYMFTWQSPVFDGAYKAMHCMELAFVFDNIQRCQEMTGGGSQARQLADKMSDAWLSFAKTGNPTCKAIPQWPQYTPGIGATLFFDNKIEVKNHHDQKLLELYAEQQKP